MTFCIYRNIFGKPNTGAHSVRVFDIAILDVISTFFIVYLMNSYYNTLENVWRDFFILLLLSVFIHKLFCVQTTLTKTILG